MFAKEQLTAKLQKCTKLSILSLSLCKEFFVELVRERGYIFVSQISFVKNKIEWEDEETDQILGFFSIPRHIPNLCQGMDPWACLFKSVKQTTWTIQPV